MTKAAMTKAAMTDVVKSPPGAVVLGTPFLRYPLARA